MKVISLINQKGGVGKTTSAIALASYLSKSNKVLLIDMDFQGNATTNCNIDEMALQYTVK
jgi:chromosome partitioning protein